MDGPLVSRRAVIAGSLAAAAASLVPGHGEPTCVKLPPVDSMIVEPEGTYRVVCHGHSTPPLRFDATAHELCEALTAAFGVPFHVREGEHGAEVVSGTAEDPRETIPAPLAASLTDEDGRHRIDLSGGIPTDIRFLDRHREKALSYFGLGR